MEISFPPETATPRTLKRHCPMKSVVTILTWWSPFTEFCDQYKFHHQVWVKTVQDCRYLDVGWLVTWIKVMFVLTSLHK